MNIFYLDEDIIKCAQFHNNRHVVKMITEHNQMLSTACHLLGFGSDEIYKCTHKNHPDAVWVRSSRDHFVYTLELTKQLAKEYTFRYGKIHAGTRLFPYFENHIKDVPLCGWTDPPQCMPDECRTDSVVDAYRDYYCKHKSHIAKWKNREVPEWFKL